MKKNILIVCCALFLAVSAFSGPLKIGIGAFGGMSLPLVQDDQATGSAFGFMARAKFLPIVTVEGNATFAKWGQADPIENVELPEGSKMTSFGIDLILGGKPGLVGFKPYAVVGFGSYKIENDDTKYDESALGWSGGFGFMFGVTPKFDIDLRGKFVVAPQDEGSKKSASVTIGVVLNLGGLGGVS